MAGKGKALRKKKSFTIECRFFDSFFKTERHIWSEWSLWKRYIKEKDRDKALAVLIQKKHTWMDFRKGE